MNYGKAGGPSLSRSRSPNLARSAAISAIPTVILSRSDKSTNMKQFLVVLACIISLNAAAQPSPPKKTMQMDNFNSDSAAIATLLTDVYFKGIYEGAVKLRGPAFYENTLLLGA